jgi:hypothetical protein
MSDIIWRSPWPWQLYIFLIYNTVSASNSLIPQIRPLNNMKLNPTNAQQNENTSKPGKKGTNKVEVQSYVLLFTSACFFVFGVPAKLFVFFSTFLHFDRFFCCSLFTFYCSLFLFVRRFLQTLSVCSLVFFNWIYFASFVDVLSGYPFCIAFLLLVLCLLLWVWFWAVLFAVPFFQRSGL